MYNDFGKRFFDFIFSLMFIILFFWLYLLLFIAVKHNLGSPVFFRQVRPGKNETLFNLYKFRTMSDKKDDKGNLLPDCDRVTKLGSWLRNTSLDELPQMFNILKGDMSFIGPRPLLVRYLPYYNEKERLRHSVRPGLSGLSQVNGRNNLDWETRFSYDIQYAQNISLSLDLEIFFKTIYKVLNKKDVVIRENNQLDDFDVYRRKQLGNK